jgi:hypothetical protein
MVWWLRMPVNSTHPLYDQFAESWQRARDVLAGEDAVKAGGIRRHGFRRQGVRKRNISPLLTSGVTIRDAVSSAEIGQCQAVPWVRGRFFDQHCKFEI